MRIVVVGGGAGGIGAAGGAKQTDPSADVVVFTEYEDVGYSPCGIPYVHGREIDSFDRLFLQDKQFYADAGIDVRYQTRVTRVDRDAHTVHIDGGGTERYDRLILATGFDYADPHVTGQDLRGLHYVKNIRAAMAFDKVLDDAKVGVVLDASPLGLEMATALAHRGLETHFVDPHPWLLAEAADPDMMEPVEESFRDLGVKLHLRTRALGFLGDGQQVTGVETTAGELPADVVVIATPKEPNTVLARAAGLKVGSTGGLVVDGRMATSDPDVFACGDCVEVPHDLTRVPVNGLTGSHAYSQGKVAGANAAGGHRRYRPVAVPWGVPAGKLVIGGVSFGETLATALGIPFVAHRGVGISKARYYPGFSQIHVKLLADPRSRRLIGAQLVGEHGIKERADHLANVMKLGATIDDLAWMENVYSPPIGALMEPIALTAQGLLGKLR